MPLTNDATRLQRCATSGPGFWLAVRLGTLVAGVACLVASTVHAQGGQDAGLEGTEARPQDAETEKESQDGPSRPRADQGLPSRQPEVARAAEHFQRGVRLFQRGAHRPALIEFRRAHEIAPNFRVLYNVGQAHLALQEHLEARKALTQYLEDGGDEVPKGRRRAVETILKTLDEYVATVTVRTNLPGATVTVDDTPVGQTPLAEPLQVDLGRHRLTLRAPDGRSVTRVVDLAAGDETVVELQLDALKHPRKTDTRRQPRLSRKRRGAIASLTSAGALAVAAISLIPLQLRAQDDFEAELANIPNGTSSDPGESFQTRKQAFRSTRKRAKAFAIATDALGAAAIVAAAAGVVLWLREGKDHERTEDAPGPKPLDAWVELNRHRASVGARLQF